MLCPGKITGLVPSTQEHALRENMETVTEVAPCCEQDCGFSRYYLMCFQLRGQQQSKHHLSLHLGWDIQKARMGAGLNKLSKRILRISLVQMAGEQRAEKDAAVFSFILGKLQSENKSKAMFPRSR